VQYSVDLTIGVVCRGRLASFPLLGAVILDVVSTALMKVQSTA